MTREFKKLNENATIPERATKHSAGYDIAASETVTIQPDEIKLVSTGLAVQLGHDEVLKLYDRSSNPVKRGIALINSVGIIDSDYYPNEFKGLFMNISKEPVTISKGQRIMQGVLSNTLQQTMTTQTESVQADLVALGRCENEIQNNRWQQHSA